MGVGVRYGLSSSLSAAGTFNPDFSQVESDAAQVGVNTTFALFYPEKRPFFQEGSDLYETWIDQVYTRQVNDPRWAVKTTGRMGRSSLAVLAAQDERTPYLMPFQEKTEVFSLERSWSALVRGRSTWGRDNALGLLGTSRLYEGGGSGSTLGVDGRLRLDRNHRFEAQVVGSWTVEPPRAGPTADLESERFAGGDHSAVFDGESFGGYAHYLGLQRSARHWDWSAAWWATSPTFRADNGFVTQNDRHFGSLNSGYTFYSEKSRWLDEWRPSLNVARIWSWEGLRKDEWIRPQISANLVGQTSASVAWLSSNERFHGEDFRGIKRWEVDVDSKFSEMVQAGAWASWGRSIARRIDEPVLGRVVNLSAWCDLKLLGRLTVQPRWEYQQLRHPGTDEILFADYVLRSPFNFQLDRRIFARLVVQYDGFEDRLSLEPLLSWRLNAFTAVYLGSSHRFQDASPQAGGGEDLATRFREDQRQFFFKIQYLFQS